MQPDQPNRTLAVLLGASEFPNAPHLADGRAFTLSAADVKRYFQDEKGLALPRGNVFSLFDDTRSPSDQLMELTHFLKRRIAELKDAGTPPTQLLIYYVGHGLFTRGDRAYCLAVRSTHQANEGATSFRAQDLVETVRGSATHLRNYWILDCCFAGKIVGQFQSSVLTAVREQILGDEANRGAAVLCSSNSREPSLAPPGLDHTMFSEALLAALRTGHPDAGPRLSLRELGDLVSENLHTAWKEDWVRPEVHSPDMREGDIAHLPLFPNPAYKPSEESVSAEKAAEERSRLGAERVRLAAAKAEEERVAAVKAEEERLAATKAAELLARKKAEQARSAAAKAEQERVAAAKAEEERLATAKAELLARKKAAQVRLAAAKAEEERVAETKAAAARKLAADKAARERARKKAEEVRIAEEQAALERARQKELADKAAAREKLRERVPTRAETAAQELFHRKAEEERVAAEERARKKPLANPFAAENAKDAPASLKSAFSSKLPTFNADAAPITSKAAAPSTPTAAKSDDSAAWAILLILLWVIVPNVAGVFVGRYLALHYTDPSTFLWIKFNPVLSAWGYILGCGLFAGIISRSALAKLDSFNEGRWLSPLHWIGFLVGFRFYNGLQPESQPSIWLAIVGIIVFLLTAMVG
jgi:hypothetical protein